MREKPRDLNLLRDALLAKRTASTAPEAAPVAALEAVSEPTADAVNTLELFEALPLDEQLSCMRAKEYDDLEQFKQKHYEKGKAVRVDINEVRRLVAGERLRELDTRLPQQLRDARDKFQSAGLTCETFSRGEGQDAWLKVMLPGRDVYVAYQYNRVVATDRIDGFPASTAGLGEFEYYIEV